MLLKAASTLLISTLALAQSTIDVDVGNGGLIFSPDTVKASPGTKVNFHFYPGDHSVAQSTYSSPCNPSGSNALYSGFVNPTSGVASQMWTITINDTSPLWLYCSQISHCQSGMVMVINPPSSGDTFQAYVKASEGTSSTTSPSNVQGGVFSPNKEGSGTGTGSSPMPSGSSVPIAASPLATKIDKLRKAHGVIMAVTVVILFPLGALSIRLLSFRGLVWLHGAWQILCLCLLTAGFGIGVQQAKNLDVLYTGIGKTHTLFGTVIFPFFWIQPFLGVLHHMMFKKKGSRVPLTYVHLFLGRALLILSIVNGGLGLKLVSSFGGPANTGGGANTHSLEIAYGVVAGVIGVAYIAGAAFGEMKRKKTRMNTPALEEEKS